VTPQLNDFQLQGLLTAKRVPVRLFRFTDNPLLGFSPLKACPNSRLKSLFRLAPFTLLVLGRSLFKLTEVNFPISPPDPGALRYLPEADCLSFHSEELQDKQRLLELSDLLC
jgi:hypothetical protein